MGYGSTCVNRFQLEDNFIPKFGVILKLAKAEDKQIVFKRNPL
jgi:hypothetical protein